MHAHLIELFLSKHIYIYANAKNKLNNARAMLRYNRSRWIQVRDSELCEEFATRFAAVGGGGLG